MTLESTLLDAKCSFEAILGCGQMGSTLMGSLQKYYFLTDLKNVPTNAINLTDFDGY